MRPCPIPSSILRGSPFNEAASDINSPFQMSRSLLGHQASLRALQQCSHYIRDYLPIGHVPEDAAVYPCGAGNVPHDADEKCFSTIGGSHKLVLIVGP